MIEYSTNLGDLCKVTVKINMSQEEDFLKCCKMLNALDFAKTNRKFKDFGTMHRLTRKSISYTEAKQMLIQNLLWFKNYLYQYHWNSQNRI